MAAVNFPAALKFVLEHEGGWSNHPADPGGATNFGITLATYRRWRDRPALTAGDLRDIGHDEVRAIYEVEYWNAVHADELPSGVDLAVFDMGVNAGVRRSALQLQTAIGMTGRQLDGAIGPVTLAAVREGNDARTVASLGELHEGHYRGLTTFAVFGRGWMRRLDGRLSLARELLRA